MRFNYFSVLLRHAGALVGNSSAGVREAPFLGVPSLNVGSRQTNRAVSHSIVSVDAHDSEAIRSFLADQWGTRREPSREFGEGCAAERFVAILAGPDIWSLPLQKHFVAPSGDVS